MHENVMWQLLLLFYVNLNPLLSIQFLLLGNECQALMINQTCPA